MFHVIGSAQLEATFLLGHFSGADSMLLPHAHTHTLIHTYSIHTDTCAFKIHTTSPIK